MRVANWNKICNNQAPVIGSALRQTMLLQQCERIQEELNETIKAITESDELELLDGLVDMRVVLEGAVYLSGLDADSAFEAVMDNNNEKYTTNLSFAERSVESLGDDTHEIQEYKELTDPDEDGYQFNVGLPTYSVHRLSDNKICKLLNHPKVDLSEFLPFDKEV